MTDAPLALTSSGHEPWHSLTGSIPLSVVRAFITADWTFAGAESADRLHPYPARYLLDLPRQAVDILKPRVAVIDPFCGSGTTLEASSAAGVPSTGVDLNPIACLVSRVRTSKWGDEDESAADAHRRNLLQACLAVTDEQVAVRVASIPSVDHWFDAWSQRLLTGAVTYLESLDADDPWRDRIALSISSAVVRLSRQDSDTRYAAVAKKGDFESGLFVLEGSLRRTCDYLRARSWKLRATANVLESDARDLGTLNEGSFDAAIFSPPYPNAYEYWLYHKYRMYWLRQDPIAVRTDELGARPHYSKKNGLNERDFAGQMGEVFGELSRVLLPASPVVIVVGDSMIGGRVIDNRSLLFDSAAEMGFTPRAATTRTLVRRRSSFNGSHGRGRDFEHVLLLERDR